MIADRISQPLADVCPGVGPLPVAEPAHRPAAALDCALAAAGGSAVLEAHVTDRLAALVVHELNTPLQAICNFLFLAEHDPGRLSGYLGQARLEVGRISLFLGRLLAFAQPDVEGLRVFSCAELVERILGLGGAALARGGLTVSSRLAPDLPPLLGAPGPLAQLVFGMLPGLEAEPGALAIEAEHCAGSSGPALQLTVVYRPAGPASSGAAPDDRVDIDLPPGLVARDGGRIALRRDRQGTVVSLVLPAM